jgi:hypothetical protein
MLVKTKSYSKDARKKDPFCMPYEYTARYTHQKNHVAELGFDSLGNK